MIITKQWLASREDKFWLDLIYLLDYISPHFGKLNWAFTSQIKYVLDSWGFKLPESWAWLKELPQQIPEESKDKEEFILKFLMTELFAVAPDYQRIPLEHTPLEITPEMIALGYDNAAYPRYYVRVAPQQDYRPLKAEEIHEEDLRLFKHKVFMAGAKWSEQQGKLAIKIARKLPFWISLIKNRQQSH
ncbi:MAG: hypothetical protein GBAus27B_000269 [Mycoplasmataceae bacterium]|nr:MAG: hypothetical protein GBAus27B_000269 [Mycoplasmataceae bacterium]